MKFSASVVTAALAGSAAAVSLSHSHGHVKKHNHAARHTEIARAAAESAAKRDEHALLPRDIASLLSLGLKAVGLNPTSSSGTAPWIGADGPFTNEFINESDEDVFMVIWGAEGSWVNAVVPDITMMIPAGTNKTVSFPMGASGAFAPIYADTKLVNGQIFETWGEFTFADLYSTVDVSREVNMNGKNMRIVTPECVTDMDTCVFTCPGGQASCWFGYELTNCAIGSQKGANYGTYYGAPSGGCSGMGNSAALKTYLSYTK